MRIGVPTEIKDNEFRVAITPTGVHALTRRGHEVTVQTGAGAGSGIDDGEYAAAADRGWMRQYHGFDAAAIVARVQNRG